MPRNPTPTRIHELKGSYKKDPQRRRKGEPQPHGGIGGPPAHLDEAEQRIWDELVGYCAPGVLTAMDRVWLEMTCRAVHLLRTEPFKKPVFDAWVVGASRMGFNPSDRAKISVAPEEEENEWNDI